MGLKIFESLLLSATLPRSLAPEPNDLIPSQVPVDAQSMSPTAKRKRSADFLIKCPLSDEHIGTLDLS